MSTGHWVIAADRGTHIEYWRSHDRWDTQITSRIRRFNTEQQAINTYRQALAGIGKTWPTGVAALHSPLCPSGKQAFDSHRRAHHELMQRWRRNNPLRRERRAYHCPECNHWHLTSQAQDEVRA